MSNTTLTINQISHYRDLAKIATDQARRHIDRRADFLALAKGWTALATALEHSVTAAKL